MRVLHVELPEKMASELGALVEGGWFADETEIVRLALLEFVRHHRFQLMEQFHRDDILWALQQKHPSS
jgi:Arc/MetJ-type ribon-helix-helix transcriptional regulator